MIVKFTLFLFKIQSHQSLAFISSKKKKKSLAFMSKYKLMANAFISMSKVQRFKELVCVCICV